MATLDRKPGDEEHDDFVALMNLGILLSDKILVGQASRQGARLAAMTGGSQNNPTMTTAQADQYIVQGVLAVTKPLHYATVTETDIYAPVNPNGSFNASTDPYDKFNGTGTLLYQSFPLSSRNQVPPTETSIGVRVVYQYTPPIGNNSPIQLEERTVMKAAAVLSIDALAASPSSHPRPPRRGDAHQARLT